MRRTKLIFLLLLSGSAFGQILQGVTLSGVSIGTTAVTQGGGGGGTQPFSSSSTLGLLMGSNTSACPSSGTLPTGCTNYFTGLTDHASQGGGYVSPGPPTTAAATNTDTVTTVPAAGNVSTASFAKLLYPGFGGTVTTKFVCHTQLWFGTSGHISTGQTNSNASLIARQADAMIARGCNIAAEDWYGQGATPQDAAMQAWRTELDSRCSGSVCPLYFAFTEDAGTHTGSPTVGTIETDISYAYSNFMNHTSYWKITTGGCSNRPVFLTFGWSLSSTDWGTIKSWVHSSLSGGVTCANEPLFGTEGESGLTDSNRDGAYNWVGIDNYDNAASGSITTPGISGTVQFNPHFLSGGFGTDSWFSVASSNLSKPLVIGSAYVGFNDTNADWGFSSPHTQGRKMSRQCGTVWVNSWLRPTATGKFSSSSQIPYMGVPTWDDYEEGSAIEPGIDNCYTVTSPAVVGSNFNWTMTASSGEASTITIDHFSLWLFDSVGNGQDVADVFTPSATTIAIPTTIPAGTWTLRVQMVGVNSIQNRLSSAVTYVK